MPELYKDTYFGQIPRLSWSYLFQHHEYENKNKKVCIKPKKPKIIIN